MPLAFACLILSLVPASLHAQAPINDDRARLANFLPPPLPPPPPAPPPPQQQANGQDGQPRRKPWRDLLDALLEMTAPRELVADSITDDPLTTGFGNGDLIEPQDTQGPAPDPKSMAFPKRYR